MVSYSMSERQPLKIVHVAPTPLVGAPGKIAECLRSKGHDAISITFSDYPNNGPLEKIFMFRSILIDSFSRKTAEEHIKKADIVHVHNFIPEDGLEWIKKINTDATFVYQVHSALREGPLYFRRGLSSKDFNYKKFFVIFQHLNRMFPNSTPVPNFILSDPTVNYRQPGEVLRVMYSPTHRRGSRWGSKYCEALDDALRFFERRGKVELVWPNVPVGPEVLLTVRRQCHVSIDEIVTGAFHQVSLEAMCAGTVAINRSDFFCNATLAQFCDGEMPPFYYANERTIADEILRLVDSFELTTKFQKKSYTYFYKYLKPNRLIGFLVDAYYDALQ